MTYEALAAVAFIVAVIGTCVAVTAVARINSVVRHPESLGLVGPQGEPGPPGPKGDRGEPGDPGVLRLDVEKLTDDELRRIGQWVRTVESEQQTYVVGETLDGKHVLAEPHADVIRVRVEDSDGDPVNHPPHYTGHPIFSGEAIDITGYLPFAQGNAVKYLWRAGRKGSTRQDVEKALWYLGYMVADRPYRPNLPATVARLKRELDDSPMTVRSVRNVHLACYIIDILDSRVDLDEVYTSLKRVLDSGDLDD